VGGLGELEHVADYTGDVDLRAKLAVWEEFYSLQRPHAALDARTPYEVLREKPLS
jgi:transposase InsO family protein